VLKQLHKDVLPNMAHPVMLMDFLTESYDKGALPLSLSCSSTFCFRSCVYLSSVFFLTRFPRGAGGVVSMLALNALFVLITRHNLDYPSFYAKLYALLTPDVLASKYRARFFRLLQLFMTSTHLPAYTVAAFAKRLARLALRAAPCVLFHLSPWFILVSLPVEEVCVLLAYTVVSAVLWYGTGTARRCVSR
jgi:U3 small nucleolar RNA-associated protein 19